MAELPNFFFNGSGRVYLMLANLDNQQLSTYIAKLVNIVTADLYAIESPF